MWRELIRALHPQAVFAPPVTRDEVDAAEERLGCRFPGHLKDFLEETDGVEGEHGLGVVWPLARIVRDNLRFRASSTDTYMPFDELLFFGDAGNGDQFAFPVTPAKCDSDEVFAWDHEDDRRAQFADSLGDYLDGWLSGRLTL